MKAIRENQPRSRVIAYILTIAGVGWLIYVAIQYHFSLFLLAALAMMIIVSYPSKPEPEEV